MISNLARRKNQSAGILVYCFEHTCSKMLDELCLEENKNNSKFTSSDSEIFKEKKILKFLLVHPGGPFWARKNEGAWTIPKGEFEEHEQMKETAIRELYEETGISVDGDLIDLGYIKQKGGKTVFAFAYQVSEFDGKINCTSYVDIEYPPKSGKIINIPEVDKGGMFTKAQAKNLINPAQYEFLEKLEKILRTNSN